MSGNEKAIDSSNHDTKQKLQSALESTSYINLYSHVCMILATNIQFPFVNSTSAILPLEYL